MITIPAPMRAPETLRLPFTDADWLYELKHDGYRCLAGVEKDDGFEIGEDLAAMSARVQLRTKSGADCTTWFPEVMRSLSSLAGGPHVLDGEVCVLRPDGTSDFNLLQERAKRRRWYPGAPQVTYCVFDLLVHDGRRIMDLPLVDRKQRLQELVQGIPGVLLVGAVPADASVFQAMVAAGLQIEGVMAKRKESVYRPGIRSPDWLKIKRSGWDAGREWKS